MGDCANHLFVSILWQEKVIPHVSKVLNLPAIIVDFEAVVPAKAGIQS